MRRHLIHFAAVAFILGGISTTSYADSPLTSTQFATPYADQPLVQMALQRDIGDTFFEGLSDPVIAHDTRAAAINALGWGDAAIGQATAYLSFIATTHGVPRAVLTLDDLSAEEALSLGYLIAMARYATLDGLAVGTGQLETIGPLTLLDHAVSEAPDQVAIQIIRSLVRSQAAMSRSWCDVYTTVATSVQRADATQFRAEAIGEIMRYIDLYQPECAVEAGLTPGPDGSVLSGD